MDQTSRSALSSDMRGHEKSENWAWASETFPQTEIRSVHDDENPFRLVLFVAAAAVDENPSPFNLYTQSNFG